MEKKQKNILSIVITLSLFFSSITLSAMKRVCPSSSSSSSSSQKKRKCEVEAYDTPTINLQAIRRQVQTQLFCIVQAGRTDLFEKNIFPLLFKHGLNINDLVDSWNQNVIHIAARYNRIVFAYRLINSLGVDSNVRNGDGQTPFFIASEKGHRDFCSMLLANGAQSETLAMWDARTQDHSANILLQRLIQSFLSFPHNIFWIIANYAQEEPLGHQKTLPAPQAPPQENERCLIM